MDAIGLQIDPAVELGVPNPGRRHGEGRVLNRDGAGRMRIAGRAGHVNLGLHHAGHVGQLGREPLHDPEIDRTAVDVQIDPILGAR